MRVPQDEMKKGVPPNLIVLRDNHGRQRTLVPTRQRVPLTQTEHETMLHVKGNRPRPPRIITIIFLAKNGGRDQAFLSGLHCLPERSNTTAKPVVYIQASRRKGHATTTTGLWQ
jgi:hypothetical protein